MKLVDNSSTFAGSCCSIQEDPEHILMDKVPVKSTWIQRVARRILKIFSLRKLSSTRRSCENLNHPTVKIKKPTTVSPALDESITITTEETEKNASGDHTSAFYEKNKSVPEMLSKCYWLNKTIGEGTFAKVYFGQHKFTKESVAIKVVNRSEVGEEIDRIEFEIEALKLFDNPYICKLYQVLSNEESDFIVMEYCPKELFDLLENGGLKEQKAKRIFRQLVLAVAHAHSKGIAHRDLKPENVLLDFDGNVKLIDFNLSGKMRIDIDFNRRCMMTHCGTIEYVAPELLRGDPYDGISSDAWSLGVILCTMLTGTFPFHPPHLKEKIYVASYEDPKYVSKKCIQLMRKLINVDPLARLTPDEILRDPWLKSVTPLEPLQTPSTENLNTHGKIELDFDEEILNFMSFRMDIRLKELKERLSKLDFSSEELATYRILERKKNLMGDNRFSMWKAAWEINRDSKKPKPTRHPRL